MAPCGDSRAEEGAWRRAALSPRRCTTLFCRGPESTAGIPLGRALLDLLQAEPRSGCSRRPAYVFGMLTECGAGSLELATHAVLSIELFGGRSDPRTISHEGTVGLNRGKVQGLSEYEGAIWVDRPESEVGDAIHRTARRPRLVLELPVDFHDPVHTTHLPVAPEGIKNVVGVHKIEASVATASHALLAPAGIRIPLILALVRFGDTPHADELLVHVRVVIPVIACLV